MNMKLELAQYQISDLYLHIIDGLDILIGHKTHHLDNTFLVIVYFNQSYLSMTLL